MIRKNIFTIAFMSGISALLILNSCNKDEEKEEEVDKITTITSDEDLYNISKETSGFVWYKNTNVLLPKSAGTGHSQKFLKTRYNSIAATNLDANFKVKTGVKFPEGSLIVKELYTDSTTFDRYAIMYKQTGNQYADANGWIWGYVNADKSVAHSLTNKGNGCINCHSQSGSEDLGLMNKYFE